MSFILFHVIISTLRVDTSNISLQELSESSQLEKEIIFVFNFPPITRNQLRLHQRQGRVQLSCE